MTQLYRAEAVEAQRSQSLGDVIVVQPLSHSILTAFLGGIVLSIGLLASAGSYARKETVFGFLSPDEGIVRVHAARPGVIGAIHVQEGHRVMSGAPLVTLRSEQTTGSGTVVDAEALRSIDSQLAEIERRRQLQGRIAAAESDRLGTALDGLTAELSAITDQLLVQRALVERLRTNLDRLNEAVELGFISSDEYLNREEKVLVAEQFFADLVQRQAATEAERQQAALAMGRIPLDTEQRLSDLASSQADLLRRRAELEAQQSVIVLAPITGTVSAIRAIKGTSVETRLPLLAVLPDGSDLEAHLFVPSRAVGFVEPGQQVRLLYDAFDYRRFGIQTGEIAEISSSVFSPSESPLGMSVKENSYRVTVRLDRQSVQAYGREFPLQAGMSLRADIVLEKRTLIEWILEPLLSLRGRG